MEYPEKNRSYLSKVLAAMVNKGMLMKLSRDLYCIIPLNADPETWRRQLLMQYPNRNFGLKINIEVNALKDSFQS